MAVILLSALDGIIKIKAEKNCYNGELNSVLAFSTLDVVAISAINFVSVVRKHKPRMLSSFDDAEVVKITDECRELGKAAAHEPRLEAMFEEVSNKCFKKAWDPAGHHFSSFLQFAAGLGFVFPTTSRVGADFSFTNHQKDEYSTILSDLSLEDLLFAGQLK